MQNRNALALGSWDIVQIRPNTITVFIYNSTLQNGIIAALVSRLVIACAELMSCSLWSKCLDVTAYVAHNIHSQRILWEGVGSQKG